MKKLFLSLLAAVMVTPMLTSCMDDDNGPNYVYYTTIVNFSKNIPNYSVFTYQTVDDAPLVELQAPGNVDTKALNEGARCVITYNYADKNQDSGSGVINLRQLAFCYTDTVSTAAEIPADFSLPYTTSMMQRSGSWINLYCLVGYTPRYFDRSFDIVADETTLDDEYPQLYLGTSIKDGAEPGVNAQTFVSVNIAPVWNRPTCKGVDIHVYDNGGDSKSVYRFEHQTI